ncbi:hypothetical protein [Streptomyces sp. 4N124]|uniref:hypothetical protein n=1 Tax=Streptomyces sp. 4N124 TaxID=3457420 RepID=UPI003FD031F2
MGKKPRSRRSFTPEFKSKTVELCKRGDRPVVVDAGEQAIHEAVGGDRVVGGDDGAEPVAALAVRAEQPAPVSRRLGVGAVAHRRNRPQSTAALAVGRPGHVEGSEDGVLGSLLGPVQGLDEVAETIVPADHADCVLRLDDEQAQQPLVRAHRDPAPTSPAAQAFLRLALARLSPHDTDGLTAVATRN